jgi:hypothetical protein
MITTFKFLQDNKDKRVVTYQQIVETVNFNMNILYDGTPSQQQVDDMILEVCHQLNVNPQNL